MWNSKGLQESYTKKNVNCAKKEDYYKCLNGDMQIKE